MPMTEREARNWLILWRFILTYLVAVTLASVSAIYRDQRNNNQTILALRETVAAAKAENVKLQSWLDDTSKALDEQALKANRLAQENEELAAKIQWQRELKKL